VVISATVRDIAIIIVAVQSIVIGILLAVLIWQIWRLVSMLQTEVKPMLDDAKATVNTAQGTVNFLSDNLAEPVIRTSGTVMRWRRTASALTRDIVPRRK